MASANQSSIITKTARLLDVLAEAQRPLGFTEIVARTQFVKSSTHRILSVLIGENLVAYEERGKTYKLGARLNNWAHAAWRRSDLEVVAARELEQLCEMTRANVALSVRYDDSVLYLRTLDSKAVRHASRAGDHAPLHCTAAGKVFLAYMPEKQRENLMARLRFERFTENTVRGPAQLLSELAIVRTRGYAQSAQEEFAHIVGIAAPIWNAHEEVTAAVSLWMVSEGASVQEIEAHAPTLLAVTQRISFQLGHEPKPQMSVDSNLNTARRRTESLS
ncbi:MAG: IclR family transcriptional regulator [Burkholderiaceae bacterium]|nr:MAG: IclR family transcriptional regulator [Burkholderiaceae bacterium]